MLLLISQDLASYVLYRSFCPNTTNWEIHIDFCVYCMLYCQQVQSYYCLSVSFTIKYETVQILLIFNKSNMGSCECVLTHTVRSAHSFTPSSTVPLLQHSSSDSVTSGPELQTDAPSVAPAIITSTTGLLGTASASPGPAHNLSHETMSEVPTSI